MTGSRNRLIAAVALVAGLAALPTVAIASVIIVSNNSNIQSAAFASVSGEPPASDSQDAFFITDTSIPAAFGDTVAAHAEVSGGGPPSGSAYADATATLSGTVSQGGAVVTVTGNGSAQASESTMQAYSGGSAAAAASSTLSLVLQLDTAYAYSFSTGPVAITPQFAGATFVAAVLADLDNNTNLFFTDTILTGCDFGCASLPAPYEGSFSGMLAAGTYGFSISATMNELNYAPFDYAEASFANASLVLTPVLAPVPIPAAVWLFGTALGLLGWVKRIQ